MASDEFPPHIDHPEMPDSSSSLVNDFDNMTLRYLDPEATSAAPKPETCLDRTAFPHIFDTIIDHFLDKAPRNKVLALRLINHEMRDRVDGFLVRHIVMRRGADRIKLLTKDGKLLPRKKWFKVPTLAAQVKVLDYETVSPDTVRRSVAVVTRLFPNLAVVRNHALDANIVWAKDRLELKASTAVYFGRLSPGDGAPMRMRSGAGNRISDIANEGVTQVIVNYSYIPRLADNRNLSELNIAGLNTKHFCGYSKPEKVVLIFTEAGPQATVYLTYEDDDDDDDDMMPFLRYLLNFIDMVVILLQGVLVESKAEVCIVGLDECERELFTGNTAATEGTPSMVVRAACLSMLITEHRKTVAEASRLFCSRVTFLSAEEWRSQVGEEVYNLANVQNATFNGVRAA